MPEGKNIEMLEDGTYIDLDIKGTPDPVTGVIRTGRVITGTMTQTGVDKLSAIKRQQQEAERRRQKKLKQQS